MNKLHPTPRTFRAIKQLHLFTMVLAWALLISVWIAIPVHAENVDPLTASVKLDKTTVAIGETVKATWSIGGGRAPYSIFYIWYVTSGGSDIDITSATIPSGTNTSSFSPTLGESCHVFAAITDADGRKAYVNSSKIPVTGSTTVEPLTTSVKLDKTTVKVGETVKGTWSIGGGRAPYSIFYIWQVTSGGSDIDIISGYTPTGTSTSSFSPTFGESCHVFAAITDADGRKAYVNSSKIPVTGSTTVEPLTASVKLDKTTVRVGETVKATWSIGGGRAPYSVFYIWYVTSGGSDIDITSATIPSGTTTSSFTPTLGESCHVFAQIKDADGRKANVISDRIPITRVYASSISIDTVSAVLDIGKQKRLIATISPTNCSKKTITWSSSNQGIATVDANGMVTAVSEGVATIKASTTDGTNLSASCRVTVNPPIPVSSITMPASEKLAIGGKVQLRPSVLPANATYKTISWKSSDTSVATVTEGLVVGIKKGTATITATAVSGAKAECRVSVTATSSRLRAYSYGMGMQFSNYTSIIFKVGAQYGTPPYTVDVTLSRDGTILHTSSYTTNGSKDVSVPVNSIPAGTYTATAAVSDAGGRIDTASTSCYMYAYGWNMGVSLVNEVRPITVITGIKFQDQSPTVAIGQTRTLSPIVSPSGAAAPSYEWTSSNPAAVSVSNTGIARGVSKGSAVITAAATDGSGLSASCTVTAYRDVDSVSLNQQQIKLKQGEKTSLTATVLPTDANYRSITWSSSNPTVATVNGGLVTGLRDGEVVIAATTSNGKRATCNVTVSNRIETINLVMPEDLPLVKDTYELDLWDTFQLKPETVPANVGAIFTYSSSNSKVAKVEPSGKVRGIKAGSCSITVTARNGSTATAVTKAIKLRVITPVSSVKVRSGFSLFVGSNRKLTASVRPDNATYKQITWSSSHPNIASVDAAGTVRANAPGSANIIATAHNGVKTSLQVRVTTPVGSITLSAPMLKLYTGKTAQITAKVLPDTADKALTWRTSSSKIATVSSNGLVKAKNAGSVKITASAKDGSKKSGSLTLRIIKPASSISMKKTLTLFTNGSSTAKLKLSTSPLKSGYLSVQWTSEHPDVATVDQAGNVTAIADGSTIIRATTDRNKTTTCRVTVLTYPSSIKLELPVDIVLRVKQKLSLAPYVKLNGSMTTLTWKTSNKNVATVDRKGLLKAKRAGRVRIRVITANNLVAEGWITIKK